jgi:hypothetical protein
MCYHHVFHTLVFCLPQEQECFFWRQMARREHQFSVAVDRSRVRDHSKDFLHLRQQLAVAGHGDKRPIRVFRAAHDVFGVKGGHPDDPSPPTRDLGHVPHLLRVDATDRPAQNNAAKHLYTIFHLHGASTVSPTASDARASVRKTSRKGVTDAWVTGTHAELRQTNSLKRRFSASSSRRAAVDATRK